MTETDNPMVKKHIEPVRGNSDEFIATIEVLDDNERTNRPMFAMRSIQPSIAIGYYSPTTKKYVLGMTSWHDNMIGNAAFQTTSTATFVLTCPAGHKYRVYGGGAQNATQASAHQLSANINGVALANIGLTSSGTVMEFFFSGAGTTTTFNGIQPIWLNAGDTLTITTNTFTALDNTEHFFLFEDYTL